MPYIKENYRKQFEEGIQELKTKIDLIHEIRKLRQMSPNDTLTIDTTPIGVLKLMLKYEKLKIKSKSKSKNGKDKK